MLIVADDLTGAADAAGAFARWGHDCRVNLRVDTGGSASVLAIDTDSRTMSASDAAGVTAEAVRRHPGRQLMIKIDSTMRGHVRATVDAAASAMHTMPRRVIVCPAFPAFGRTVVDGVAYSGGEPLAAGQLREVFSGTAANAELCIADASTDDELDAVVGSYADDHDVLWVGSAGLAGHLARRMTPTNGGVDRTPARRIVVVTGSQHERTATQLSDLADDTLVFAIDPRDITLAARLGPLLAAVDGLVLTGGHTARVVLDMLGVDGFAVGGEVEVGVPWGTAVVAGRVLTLVTKAGGFGDRFTLQRAVEFLAKP